MGRGAAMAEKISVEVAYALPEEQAIVSVSVEEGASPAEALAQSGFLDRFAKESLEAQQIGVWGRAVGRDYQLKEGDRVEVYRPLQRDPRDARRALAQSGLTMSETSND